MQNYHESQLSRLYNSLLLMRRPKTYIIDEEEHLENLRKIIKRDFFKPNPHNDNEDQPIDLKLNDYVANFKSNENQTFTELVRAHDKDWKQQNQWMQKAKQLMLQAPDKPFTNMITRPEGLKAIDHTIVQQQAENQIFFKPTGETNSYRESGHNQAKKVIYENCRMEDQQMEKFAQKHRKLNRDPNLEEIPETPVLEGRQVQGDKADQQYPMVQAASIEPQDIPIMTWGNLESTPLRLNSSEYRIPETPKRDQVLEELNSKITKEKLIKKNKKDELKMKILSSVRGGSSYRKVSVQRYDSAKRQAVKKEDSRLDGLLNFPKN